MGLRPFLERVRERVVIGDGAVGSLLHSRGYGFSTCYAHLSIESPLVVREIHLDYLKAGAELIETNSYGANRSILAQFKLEAQCREINARAAQLAKQMAGDDAYVAGAVGPLLNKPEKLAPEQMRAQFAEQIEALADGGADLILLETFVAADEARLALEAARSVCDLPVVVSFAFGESGVTPGGVAVTAAIRGVQEADAIGVNANAGPLGTLRVVERLAHYTELPIVAMPSSSMPQYLAGANFYLSHPDYFAENGAEMVGAGANVVGGCIGTTPADIQALAEAVRGRAPVARHVQVLPPAARPRADAVAFNPVRYRDPGAILESANDHKLAVVEIDPPRGLNYRKQLASVTALSAFELDAITVADNALATIRLNALVMAHIYQEHCGVRALLHVSCRDRNLLGMQSHLLGAHAMGVTNLLAVTGDPASVGGQEGATSVFDLNSKKLIRLIRRMNLGENLVGEDLPTNFSVGCALDPNATRLDGPLRNLKAKAECGAQFCLTQPVYDIERAVALYRRLAEDGVTIPVLLGVMPLVSERNAEFLHNEVPGITIPDAVRERMRGLSGKAGREAGAAIAREIVDAVFEDCPGFYFIAPFEAARYVSPLLAHVRDRESAAVRPGVPESS